ncbi:hypothetical protein J5X84_22355 [Streptosporangiaceae bacterium NEAU-GS5]|nr:hypothetical protein [Streptosporangiaceae bacterium NEAU-GS5]
MSYDLYFLRREPGQSWDEALESLEEERDEPAAFDAEAWAKVLAASRAVLGEMSVFENPAVHSWEITHEETGLQIGLFEGEWSMTVPYWTRDEQARAVMRKMYAIALAVAQITGLECYDPQVGEPLSEVIESDGRAAVPHFNSVANLFGHV